MSDVTECKWPSYKPCVLTLSLHLLYFNAGGGRKIRSAGLSPRTPSRDQRALREFWPSDNNSHSWIRVYGPLGPWYTLWCSDPYAKTRNRQEELQQTWGKAWPNWLVVILGKPTLALDCVQISLELPCVTWHCYEINSFPTKWESLLSKWREYSWWLQSPPFCWEKVTDALTKTN